MALILQNRFCFLFSQKNGLTEHPHLRMRAEQYRSYSFQGIFNPAQTGRSLIGYKLNHGIKKRTTKKNIRKSAVFADPVSFLSGKLCLLLWAELR